MYRCLFVLLIISLFFVAPIAGANPDRLVYQMVEVDCPDQQTAQLLQANGFDLVRLKVGETAQIVTDETDFYRLQNLEVNYTVVHEDLTAYYQGRLYQPANRSLEIGQGSMSGYFTFNEIVAFVDSLRSEYAEIMSVPVVIGQTVDGYDITAYKLSDQPNVDEDEPETLIVGLHHAREPMSIVAPLYFTRWLVENYGTDDMATFIVNEREVWIVPILNIDGYLYNQALAPMGGGMWRKNKQDNNNNGIFDPSYDGVDLNRNYGYMWGYDDYGSSPIPGDATYRGNAPFCAPETAALRDFCNDHEFRIALNFHTFGDLLIQPWGYSDSAPLDDAIFKEYALEMIRDSEYVYGYGSQTVGYVTNGGSDDWMYGEQTNKPKIMAYTPEIGHDGDGFWAPTDRILTLAQENLYTQTFAALASGTYLKVLESRYVDAEGGDGDFAAEAGETVAVFCEVRNMSYHYPADQVTATLISNDPYVTIIDSIWVVNDIPALTTVEAQFIIELSPETPTGHLAEMAVHFSDANGYDLREETEFILGSPFVLFFDNAENGTGNWDTGQLWGVTDEDRSDGQFSFTDSPYQAYPPNWVDDMTLLDPISLTGLTNAVVTYETKWHMEDHWDLAQLQLSVDYGGSWFSWPGEHTTRGTGINGSMQPLNQSVYNGFRHLKWLDEMIMMEPFVGADLTLRFHIASDGGTQGDGWYVDNIAVIGFSETLRPPTIFMTNEWQNTNFTGPFPIFAGASDAQGVSSVDLHYRVNGGEFGSLPLINQELFLFTGEIPEVSYDSHIDYYLQATDEEGQMVTHPANAPAEYFHFYVTDQVQDIAIEQTGLEYNVPQGHSESQGITIHNEGYLPLQFAIFDSVTDGISRGPAEYDQTPPFLSESYPLESAISYENIERAIARATGSVIINPVSDNRDDPPSIAELQLVLMDPLGDQVGNAPDVIGLYAEVLETNDIYFKLKFSPNSAPATGIFVMSLDLDQDIGTGAYPPGLGSSVFNHDIGSEIELVWDPANYNGLGSVIIVLDETGNQFYGAIPITISYHELEATLPLAMLGGDDGYMDVVFISLFPHPELPMYDFMPDVGHGTVGPGGDAPWLIENPRYGFLGEMSSQEVSVSVLTELLEMGTYFADLRIFSNDPDESFLTIPVTLTVSANAVEDEAATMPVNYTLGQNFPNPFQAETTIRFQLPTAQHARVMVYNVTGQQVRELVNRELEAGHHRLTWDGRSDDGLSVSSGVYFYRLEAGPYRQTLRLVLMR